MSLSSELRVALNETLQANDIAVRWRKGSHVTVWIFRIQGDSPVLMGYGIAHRNWRRDPLHRDIFTMLELDAASKGYEQVVFALAMEITYPVMFKRLRDDGPKKVQKPTGDLYRGAITITKWNKSLGKKSGIKLEPEKKPVMPDGRDKTRAMGITR